MNVEFAFPWSQLPWWIFAAILLLSLLAYALRRLEGLRGVRLRRFVDLELAPRLLIGHNARLRKPLFWLTWLGFAAMGMTLAQPHWGEDWQEVTRRSHDILICLDISESMHATDLLPNRLERAKRKIVSILDRSPGDRFGLVAFSGAAQLMCPLTLDRGYFRSVLNALDTDSISLKGTDIAAALVEAIRTFREADEESTENSIDSRAILLISDGEEVSGDAITLAAEAATYARIFVIGVGDSSGVEITMMENRGGRRVAVGEPHWSRLDEETLRQVAMEGKGGYITSTPHNGDIERIYELTQQLASKGVSGDLRLQLVNRFQWPLTVAIVCFFGEALWLALLPRLGRRGQGAHGQEALKRYA